MNKPYVSLRRSEKAILNIFDSDIEKGNYFGAFSLYNQVLHSIPSSRNLFKSVFKKKALSNVLNWKKNTFQSLDSSYSSYGNGVDQKLFFQFNSENNQKLIPYEYHPKKLPKPDSKNYSTPFDQSNENGTSQKLLPQSNPQNGQKLIPYEYHPKKLPKPDSKNYSTPFNQSNSKNKMDYLNGSDRQSVNLENGQNSDNQLADKNYPSSNDHLSKNLKNNSEDLKNKRIPKKPFKLTFSFRNIFRNKYYQKYRYFLNTAAILVAMKKFDEALEYYYVIQDQNIPYSLKIMIQKNIQDIKEAIAKTMKYSDTIVKVDETGEVEEVKFFEKISKEIICKPDHLISVQKVSFDE